jgi:hypothetical protein
MSVFHQQHLQAPPQASMRLCSSKTPALHVSQIDVAQTPRFNPTKRRRLYGLNSRFDHMLQEVTWACHAPTSSLSRRKRAYSSGSSSMTNHDSPKTPTEVVEHRSTKLGKSFVPAMPENWLPGAMSGGKAHLGSSQVGKMGDLVLPIFQVGS